jgi:hypothetical protein
MPYDIQLPIFPHNVGVQRASGVPGRRSALGKNGNGVRLRCKVVLDGRSILGVQADRGSGVNQPVLGAGWRELLLA